MLPISSAVASERLIDSVSSKSRYFPHENHFILFHCKNIRKNCARFYFSEFLEINKIIYLFFVFSEYQIRQQNFVEKADNDERHMGPFHRDPIDPVGRPIRAEVFQRVPDRHRERLGLSDQSG